MPQPEASAAALQPDERPAPPAGTGDRPLRADIDTIEIGHKFLVVSGSLSAEPGSLDGRQITIRVGDAEQRVTGFFEPSRSTPNDPRAAFRIDIPRPPGDLKERELALLVDGRQLLARPIAELGFASFVPVARIERADQANLSGWIFDPGLWHAPEADALELVIGQHRLPIELSVERLDLPFSAARTGRPIGFDVPIAEALEKKLGERAFAELLSARDLRVALYSFGLNLVSERIELQRTAPEPASGERAAATAPVPAPTPASATEVAAPVPAVPRRAKMVKTDRSRVELHVDEALLAPGAGVVVMGWLLDPLRLVRSLRVRWADELSPPLAERWFPIDRPDVVHSYGRRLGVEHPGVGFHAFAPLPNIRTPDFTIEIEYADGTIASKPLAVVGRSIRDAIIRMLADVKVTSGDAARLCTHVFGAPIAAVGRTAMLNPAPPVALAEGVSPERPRCSMIVPLYGRVDFLHYQAALMHEHSRGVDEWIYVLDDPDKKDDFLALARRVHLQLDVPLRLLVLPRNLGFAAANNAGLRIARGDYVCFLNSDVFPITHDWVDRLVGALAADPGLGLVGARLLFEDGTVQHAGMAMERLPELGNLAFPRHPGKGRLVAGRGDVRRVPMVTGACIMMRRALAVECGGFSTDYVIGDFEDADLCMRVESRGLECAVHDGVELYHLERQSQGPSSNRWRHNLTLINAWVFAGKWDRPGAEAAGEAQGGSA